VVLEREPTDLGWLSEPGAVSGVFQRGRGVRANAALRTRGMTDTLS
jgi:hypothetical protein